MTGAGKIIKLLETFLLIPLYSNLRGLFAIIVSGGYMQSVSFGFVSRKNSEPVLQGQKNIIKRYFVFS